MRLYGIEGSPNTWKVRAVAHHLGLPLEFQDIDVFKGENRTPAYLAMNPTGRTPVLVDGDMTLWESTAIMHYLAATTRSSLLPTDPRAAADVLRWQSWQLAHWGKEACEPLTFEQMLKPMFGLGATDAAVVARATSAWRREAAVLDAHLAGRRFLVGDALTLADFSVGSYLFLAEPARFPMAGFPEIARWFGTIAAVPCWHATAPRMSGAA